MYISVRNTKLFLYGRKLRSGTDNPYLIEKEIRKPRFIKIIFATNNMNCVAIIICSNVTLMEKIDFYVL